MKEWEDIEKIKNGFNLSSIGYCEKCGKKLIPEMFYRKRYDVITGYPVYKGFLICPTQKITHTLIEVEVINENFKTLGKRQFNGNLYL
jgi:hypothetical protein